MTYGAGVTCTPRGLLDFELLPSNAIIFRGLYNPIPLYYSRNIKNLFMAGRNISTTRLALASTRIIACCATGGQAVGIAAALCAKYGCEPRELAPHIGEVQQLMLKADAFIPEFKNTDPADKARSATFTASSFVAGGEPQKVVDGISRRLDDDSHAWITDGISPEGESLIMKLAKPEILSELHLTFDSNFNYPIRVTMAYNRQIQQRIGVPPELVRDYTVTLERDGKEIGKIEVKDNFKRKNIINFDPVECDTVKIHITATNGADKITVFEVRAY